MGLAIDSGHEKQLPNARQQDRDKRVRPDLATSDHQTACVKRNGLPISVPMNTISNTDIEKTAQDVAAQARADGKNEHEVAAAFASVLPHHTLPTLPALPTRDDLTPLEQKVYDIGVQAALQGKALPLEPHPAFEAGYQDTRAAMLAQLRPKQEPVATEETPVGGGKVDTTDQDDYDRGYLYASNGNALPKDAPAAAQKGYDVGKAEYDAGAAIAKRGDQLPDNSSDAAKNGFAHVLSGGALPGA